MFIALDGGDGSGKTTQITLLAERLKKDGYEVLVCREPGSTVLGEAIRQILLDFQSLNINRRSELFLFMAARAQLLEEIVQPALDAGKFVLVDRFFLSTVVYQGYALDGSTAEIWTMGQTAIGKCYPDLTFLLDLAPEVAIERIEHPLDRIEAKGIEFHQKVRVGFKKALEEFDQYFPGKGFLVDASRSMLDVNNYIYNVIQNYFQKE